MANTPDGRAFVELDIRAPDGTFHPLKIMHDDEVAGIEQQILATSPSPSSNSKSQKLSREAERAIHEAILDAPRMELVQTAHERDNNIDKRLQRYRFMKERNKALANEVQSLTQSRHHERRYALDVAQSPSRATMLRQVAVESQRREMKVMDRVRSLESECKQQLERALKAESRVRILEAQVKASRSLDLRHAAGGADIGRKYGNVSHQSTNFASQDRVDTLEREKMVLESKIKLLESQCSSSQQTRGGMMLLQREAVSPEYRAILEKARREVQHGADNFNSINTTVGAAGGSSSGMETSPGGTPFRRVTHVHAHHEVATLKEELSRVLTEYDQSVLDNQKIIAQQKEENLRLTQSLQRGNLNWERSDELDNITQDKFY
jgi:hypothetical protein